MVSRVALGVVVASLMATGAQAQTTSCYRSGYQVICNTQQAPQAPQINFGALQTPNFAQSYMQGAMMGQAMRERRAAQQQSEYAEIDRQQARIAAEAREHLLDQVSTAIKSGDCEGAKQIALTASDIGLADAVVRICSAGK